MRRVERVGQRNGGAVGAVAFRELAGRAGKVDVHGATAPPILDARAQQHVAKRHPGPHRGRHGARPPVEALTLAVHVLLLAPVARARHGDGQGAGGEGEDFVHGEGERGGDQAGDGQRVVGPRAPRHRPVVAHEMERSLGDGAARQQVLHARLAVERVAAGQPQQAPVARHPLVGRRRVVGRGGGGGRGQAGRRRLSRSAHGRRRKRGHGLGGRGKSRGAWLGRNRRERAARNAGWRLRPAPSPRPRHNHRSARPRPPRARAAPKTPRAAPNRARRRGARRRPPRPSAHLARRAAGRIGTGRTHGGWREVQVSVGGKVWRLRGLAPLSRPHEGHHVITRRARAAATAGRGRDASATSAGSSLARLGRCAVRRRRRSPLAPHTARSAWTRRPRHRPRSTPSMRAAPQLPRQRPAAPAPPATS